MAARKPPTNFKPVRSLMDTPPVKENPKTVGVIRRGNTTRRRQLNAPAFRPILRHRCLRTLRWNQVLRRRAGIRLGGSEGGGHEGPPALPRRRLPRNDLDQDVAGSAGRS